MLHTRRLFLLAAAMMGLSGCAGPLVVGGEVYFGRAFVVRPTQVEDDYIPKGIPLKEAQPYHAMGYIIHGECSVETKDNGIPLEMKEVQDCQVKTVDLGRMPLPSPDRLLEFEYRGGLLADATVTLEINDNSSLRTLSVEEDNGPSLYFHFGKLGTGLR